VKQRRSRPQTEGYREPHVPSLTRAREKKVVGQAVSPCPMVHNWGEPLPPPNAGIPMVRFPGKVFFGGHGFRGHAPFCRKGDSNSEADFCRNGVDLGNWDAPAGFEFVWRLRASVVVLDQHSEQVHRGSNKPARGNGKGFRQFGCARGSLQSSAFPWTSRKNVLLAPNRKSVAFVEVPRHLH